MVRILGGLEVVLGSLNLLTDAHWSALPAVALQAPPLTLKVRLDLLYGLSASCTSVACLAEVLNVIIIILIR